MRMFSPGSNLVHASDFIYRARHLACARSTQEEQLFHSVWQRVRGPLFVLPRSICMHCHMPEGRGCHTFGQPSSWEVYDMNLAGCLLCGEMHVCQVRIIAMPYVVVAGICWLIRLIFYCSLHIIFSLGIGPCLQTYLRQICSMSPLSLSPSGWILQCGEE